MTELVGFSQPRERWRAVRSRAAWVIPGKFTEVYRLELGRWKGAHACWVLGVGCRCLFPKPTDTEVNNMVVIFVTISATLWSPSTVFTTPTEQAATDSVATNL
jgi:hypothetical protein